MPGRYDDIIHLPHHVSQNHAPMPREERAAQFSPFAALVGFDDVIEEAARYTDARPELDENRKLELDARLRLLEEAEERPEIIVTRFLPDESKPGGAILDLRCRVRRVDPVTRLLTPEEGEPIPVDDILDLRGAFFRRLEDAGKR